MYLVGFTKVVIPNGMHILIGSPINCNCSRSLHVKHKIADDVDVNLRIDLPTQDLEDLVDKITESVLVMIAAATVAHILKQVFTKAA